MRLLLDECVSLPTHTFLRQSGYDCVTVHALGRSGAANGELLALAKTRRLILVTIDRGMGNLRTYPLDSHAGLIVLKVPSADQLAAVHRHLADALKTIPADHLTGSLLIVDRTKFRLRRLT